MKAPEIKWITPPDQVPPIMWRYMRLSTLLLLLQEGRVYIPTIEELKRGDPTEATIVCDRTRRYFSEELSDEDRDWLKQKADTYERSILNSGPPTDDIPRVQMQIWIRELAKRRCAWCWFGGSTTTESMALWTIYASQGVALLTTPKKLADCIDRSLTALHPTIGKVEYVSSGYPVGYGDQFLLRPYFFKKNCFEHEKEVRIVFPRSTDSLDRGLLLSLVAGVHSTSDRDALQLMLNKLIAKVVISPLIPRNEAEAVRDAIVRVLGKKQEHLVELSPANDIELTAADELKHVDAWKNEISCLGEPRGLPSLLKLDLK